MVIFQSLAGFEAMTATKDLPQFVRDLLASPPRAGEGVNLYLFRLARVLHPYRSESEIANILRAVTAGCGRVVIEKEIWRAIENSKAAAWTPGEPVSFILQPPWPMVNAEQREAVIEAADGFGLQRCPPMNRPASFDHPRVEEVDDLATAVIPRAVGHSYELRARPCRTIRAQRYRMVHERAERFLALAGAEKPTVKRFTSAVHGQRQRRPLCKVRENSRLLISRAGVLLNHRKPSRPRVFQSVLRLSPVLCVPGARKHWRGDDQLRCRQFPPPRLTRTGGKLRSALCATKQGVFWKQQVNDLLRMREVVFKANRRAYEPFRRNRGHIIKRPEGDKLGPRSSHFSSSRSVMGILQDHGRACFG